jgi:hypothetical protein
VTGSSDEVTTARAENSGSSSERALSRAILSAQRLRLRERFSMLHPV